jgi:RHS repeat-associated protein
LKYDSLDRLREISYHGSVQVDRFWYDSAGLRIKREERINIDVNTTKTYTIYSGNDPLLQETYVGTTRTSVRFNVIDGGQILAQYQYVYGTGESVRYFYLDQIGSRRVVKDGSGAVTDKFSYSAWGEATQTQGTASELASFTGKDYDATGLQYFNARYYDPTIGRFITEDPSRKGTGWFTYCSNNPVNRTDPTGRYDPDDPDRGRPAASPSSYQPVQPDLSTQPVKMTTRGIAGGGASNEVPAAVLRGEDFIVRRYGLLGEGYTQYIPANAMNVDCTQYVAYANNLPVVGSGGFATSKYYVKVDVAEPGDTVVWRYTNLEGERKGHAAIWTGEEGGRALLQAYGEKKPIGYGPNNITAEFENFGYTNIGVEYYRPRRP